MRKECTELQAAPPGDYSALFEMHIIAFFFFFCQSCSKSPAWRERLNWVLKRVWVIISDANCSAESAENTAKLCWSHAVCREDVTGYVKQLRFTSVSHFKIYSNTMIIRMTSFHYCNGPGYFVVFNFFIKNFMEKVPNAVSEAKYIAFQKYWRLIAIKSKCWQPKKMVLLGYYGVKPCGAVCEFFNIQSQPPICPSELCIDITWESEKVCAKSGSVVGIQGCQLFCKVFKTSSLRLSWIEVPQQSNLILDLIPGPFFTERSRCGKGGRNYTTPKRTACGAT